MEWNTDELRKIAETDDLHISPFREDGTTYGTPTWIWSVVVDDNLYVRGYNGQQSRWYQAAIRQKAGRIRVGATGVMQVMPATGQELKVGDITRVENKVNAGVKYIRFTIDHYFKDEPMDRLNKGLFAFASYNAGRGRTSDDEAKSHQRTCPR